MKFLPNISLAYVLLWICSLTFLCSAWSEVVEKKLKKKNWIKWYDLWVSCAISRKFDGCSSCWELGESLLGFWDIWEWLNLIMWGSTTYMISIVLSKFEAMPTCRCMFRPKMVAIDWPKSSVSCIIGFVMGFWCCADEQNFSKFGSNLTITF